ncbi:hypothetical protein LPB72_02480 [Hydrogenophaga crassostreae]|uniref:DUF2855 domain-containing protein n=1 Tax=Hydrogenophaga crassostreae TaxID=1763535 RepID=A0A162SXI1_9BURK|nr:DUF2855 family protein [Hydrogenophaga crassostreae]AOW11945.1 hypothetical protein LPB072_02780 [Hydrogenophaga crassostreae]OAD43892.1 hypothetical protein LPB72_02480 [Hydrogenophaga crassostreae]
MTTTTLQVRKNQISQTRWTTTDDAPLKDGEVRTEVELFALTANNITYAAMGDAMRYWDFYPSGDAEWGVIPVWGFATVIESRHAEVAVGERLYGYWPTANHAVLQPSRVTPLGFSDAAPHRAELHAVYNQLIRTSSDAFHMTGTESVQALLRPLFLTSWLIDDFLDDNNFFGATTLLLSSASSKTAYGTAFQLAQRKGVKIIGLTSDGNKAFCESLGCYSQVVGYGELDQIAADTPCVYLDFAGNGGLRTQIHERFTALRYSCAIGATHVESLRGAKGLPGPTPTMFFAPAQVKKRNQDWGAPELGRRMVEAWQAFTARASDPTKPWMTVEHQSGQKALEAAYQQMLKGGSNPAVGQTFTLL